MIEVICGPMFSGKTEELIRRIKRVKIAGENYIVIKPSIESRYEGEKEGISTHDDMSINALALNNCLPDVFYETKDYDVIAIDEAQFFDKNLYQIVLMLSDRGKRVIVSGLDTDFRREPFVTMSNIMAIADKVDKLHSICMGCKKDAVYSLRTTDETDLMVIGSSESYIPLCGKCYTNKSK